MRRTLLVALSLHAVGAALAAQAAAQEPVAGAVVLGMTWVPAPFPIDLPPAPPLPPGVGPSPFGVRRPSFPSWTARLRLQPPVRGLPAPEPPALAQGAPGREPGLVVGPDTAAVTAQAPPPRQDSTRLNLLPDAVQEFADIGMRVQGRGELGGAWIRYRPCEPGLRLNCEPGLFPRIQPDVQFGVQVGGTISDRVHVDVDWDQRREFDATNNINVYYEGLPGEVLQRVEVGDVSLELPRSRYLTQGIPAGNFGFKAVGQLGALDLQAVWAQQKGDVATREFRLEGAGGAGGLVQDAAITLDDADYVRGQFFFIVDPSQITGAPHFDALTLVPSDASPALRPRAGALAIYRDEAAVAGNFQEQAQQGYFLADAVAEDGSLRHSGLFRLLDPGQDYLVHPSGLWIMLRVPLRPDEALAVAFVTEAGDTVGTPGAESLPPGATPQLRLIRAPETVHQPNQSTWPLEMHQVYRLDASGNVELPSLELTISLGQASAGLTFEDVNGQAVPYLRLFGLDEDAPVDRVDEAHVFRPADLAGLPTTGGIRGTYVVFPTLEPFGRPPPVPSENLTATENAAIIGTDLNTAIYDELDPVERRNAARFRLNFDYRVRTEGLASTFNLGAFGIRDGSERITVDGQPLVRGVDYIIDYDLGTVTLLNPQEVLGANPQAEIRATWEQQSLFQIAPTTVFGLSSHYDMGPGGEINVMGMYQSERTLMTRPQLGTEPGAVMLGGASMRLERETPWLDRVLEAIPGLRSGGGSGFDVASELALSLPDPNTRGATYLDDFESTDELPLSLEQQNWRLGSMPQDATGAGSVFPLPLRLRNATPLVWQDRYLEGGHEQGFLQPQQIDRQINVAGARLAERALYLTVGDPSRTTSDPRWRSITTPLSPSGLDLSRSEYLEVYVDPMTAGAANSTLVFDIGTVGEDAYYYDQAGDVSGVTDQGIPWGVDVLDEEARLAQREVWGPEADARGLWDQACEADRLNPVPLGDRRANCTVNNGRPDSEDLNGNGVLDPLDGQYYRYVVPLDALTPYLVRDENETGTDFRLYRIPLRGAAATPVNGASAATWRFVKQVRLTVVNRAPGTSTLALARLRITGSRWTKRNVHGIVDGLVSTDEGLPGTTSFRVGSVSRLTEGANYRPPAGVTDQVPDPTQALGASGVEFNEKGLKLGYDALGPAQRGEVYYRYPQQARSYLSYGEIRLYALPYRGDWGPAGTQRLLVKVGTDAGNYYLYRTPLGPAAGGGAVVPEDWLPEVVIEFDRWLALRAVAETQLASRPAGITDPVVVWGPDSTYAVVLQDRARAPNLAAVREIGFAVYNGGGGSADGEVWLDDIRLGRARTDPGLAGRLDVNLNAGEFLSTAVEVGLQGGRFRQLDAEADYQRALDLNVATTARLGRFAPESWGVEAPFTVSYVRTGTEPIYLAGTDLVAADLQNLRQTRSTRRRVGIALRKTTPTPTVLGLLVDGLALRAGYSDADARYLSSTRTARAFDGQVSYERRPVDLRMDIVPQAVEDVLRAITPRKVEESEFFQNVAGAELRVTPARLAFSSAYHRQEDRTYRYAGILVRPLDAAVTPLESPREALENRASVTLQPFESVTAAVTLASARDLLDTRRATSQPLERDALDRARTELAGIDVGWERDRTVASELAVRPRLAEWLRPNLSYTGRFGLRRQPGYLELVTAGADTTAVLQRSFQGERRVSRGFVLDLGGLGGALFGLPDPEDMSPEALGRRALVGGMASVLPLELTWDDGLASRFERETADPGLGYQLGLGGTDAFRIIGRDTAATTIQRDGFRVRSGLRLPAHARLELGYNRYQTDVRDVRAGQRLADEKDWPDIRLTWEDIPVPPLASPVFQAASVSTGVTRTLLLTTIAYSGVPVERTGDEWTVPLQLRFTLGGGLTVSYSGSVTDGQGSDPTGGTERAAASHAVTLGGRFVAPPALQERFPKPIGVSFRFDYQAEQQCRITNTTGEEAGECTPYIDFLNRRLDVTLDTFAGQINVGLQISYTDRRSFVGTRSGSSQFQLGLFGQFDFEAGRFTGGSP